MTKYERNLLAKLFPFFNSIRGTWIRMWPHPVSPGCQVFVGHQKRLAEIEAICHQAGFVIGPTKPDGQSFERPSEGEIEISRRRVRASA